MRIQFALPAIVLTDELHDAQLFRKTLHGPLLAVKINAVHNGLIQFGTLLPHKSLNSALAIWSDANHLLGTEGGRSINDSRAGLKRSSANSAMNADALLMGE